MRIGLLRIASVFLERGIEETSEVLSKIKFVPFRVEHLWHYREFEMIGYSPFFDEIEEGETTPEYNLIISRFEENGIEVTVEKENGTKMGKRM